MLFRSVATLPQKVGVSLALLRRAVLKELTDNALDATSDGEVRVGAIGDDRFFVEDDGDGIVGGGAEIAKLFSINRPLKSTKLWRLPTRGAMGNGLRVVVGAVMASYGKLEVHTRSERHILTPQDDGSTIVRSEPIDRARGTRVEIEFGAALPRDPDALDWAEAAIKLAPHGEQYRGRPSPHWYDADQFYELLQSAEDRPIRELIAQLDRCSGGKAGRIVDQFKGATCSSLSREQAKQVLVAARALAKIVRPERLGTVGREAFLMAGYSRMLGDFATGARKPYASVPYIVEVWANVDPGAADNGTISVFVNRSPITGAVYAPKSKGNLTLYGCGLRHQIDMPKGSYEFALNVTAPYVPITSDGKAPYFSCFADSILKAVDQACKRARRAALGGAKSQQNDSSVKAEVLAVLEQAIAFTSSDGSYRFRQRMLFYTVREMLDKRGSAKRTLQWNNFTNIITDYEVERGQIAGMIRDARGTLILPHGFGTYPLGTETVETFVRPDWSFNKLLFVEKEGIADILAASGWHDRHDCAIIGGKGYSTRAIRDLIDDLAQTDEPIAVFALHDADADGTMIYQTLQFATKAREAREITIVNLGLDPWQAKAMGLMEETFPAEDRERAIADYVLDHG